MKLGDLLPRLQAEHFSSPQACHTISAAIAEVEHGLGLLAHLGHVFHLEAGPPYNLPEWPRILFHVTSAPNGRVVRSETEAWELGEGWWGTLAEAQNKEGIRAQFRGRGGIGDRSLPMLVDGGPAGPRPSVAIPPKANGEIIDEWKRAIEALRSSGAGVWANGVTIDDGGTETAGGKPNGESTAVGSGSGDVRSPGNGSGGLGTAGNKAGVRDPETKGPDRVPEDVVPRATVSDRGERG